MKMVRKSPVSINQQPWFMNQDFDMFIVYYHIMFPFLMFHQWQVILVRLVCIRRYFVTAHCLMCKTLQNSQLPAAAGASDQTSTYSLNRLVDISTIPCFDSISQSLKKVGSHSILPKVADQYLNFQKSFTVNFLKAKD